MGFPADQGQAEVAFQVRQVPTEDLLEASPEARQLRLTDEHQHQLEVVTVLRSTEVEVVTGQTDTMGPLLTMDLNMDQVGMED